MIPCFQTVSGPVTSSADWKLDSEELAKLFNSKTKAIIINNPNNPLGKVPFFFCLRLPCQVFSLGELEEVCALAVKHDVLVIADDV